MENKSEFDSIKDDLYDIVESIMLHLKLIQTAKLKKNFNDMIKKLSSLDTTYENNEINNFVYFLKKLFLDKNNNFDFSLFLICEKIPENEVKLIFNFLLQRIEEFNFFNFLIDLGKIFAKLYFQKEDMIEITEEYEHKGITNYECILKLLCTGKKEKISDLFFGNFSEYYSLEYINTITHNISFSINLNYWLSISSKKNYKNILNNFINEYFFNIYEDEKKQLNEIEEFIRNSINVYWCNSIFFLEEDFEDFLNIFYNFITEKNTKKFINIKKNEDDFYIKYLEYVSSELKILFKNFDNDSLGLFEKNLYNFIINSKDSNKNNYYIDFMLRIKQNNSQINKKDLGLISMLVLNKKFISDLEEEVKSNNNIEIIIEKCQLNKYEIVVLIQLWFDFQYKIQKNDSIIDENIIEINNTIEKTNDEIKKNRKIDIDINQKEKDSNIENIGNKNNISKNSEEKLDICSKSFIKIKENIENINKNNNMSNLKHYEDNKKIDSLDKIKSTMEITHSSDNGNNIIDNNENFNSKTESLDINKTKNNQKEIDSIRDYKKDNVIAKPKENEIQNLIDNLKLNQTTLENKDLIIDILKKMNSKIILLEKYFEESKLEFQKYKKENDEYKKENDEYWKNNDEYWKKNDEYWKKNEEYKINYKKSYLKYEKEKKNFFKWQKRFEIKLNTMNDEIKKLKNIHNSIFFRDLSKFYIREFSEMFNVEGNSMYNICQNILKLNFDLVKLQNFKSIMIKIVNHYLSGNKNYHIEYFINQNNESNERIQLENIQNYYDFMKFSSTEQNILKNSFNLKKFFYLLPH